MNAVIPPVHHCCCAVSRWIFSEMWLHVHWTFSIVTDWLAAVAWMIKYLTMRSNDKYDSSIESRLVLLRSKLSSTDFTNTQCGEWSECIAIFMTPACMKTNDFDLYDNGSALCFSLQYFYFILKLLTSIFSLFHSWRSTTPPSDTSRVTNFLILSPSGHDSVWQSFTFYKTGAWFGE